MSQSIDKNLPFDCHLYYAVRSFELTQAEFVSLMQTAAAQNVQLLLDILSALDERNPAEHSALIEEWCRADNALLSCSPVAAVKAGRLEEVLNAARQAQLVEPPDSTDWSWLKTVLQKPERPAPKIITCDLLD